MVMSEGRKVCNYYVWVYKYGLFTADGCQKGVMNNTLLLVIVFYSIDNSPIHFLQDCSIGIFCLSIIAVHQRMMILVKKTRQSEKFGKKRLPFTTNITITPTDQQTVSQLKPPERATFPQDILSGNY
jgi:hypothetical protein